MVDPEELKILLAQKADKEELRQIADWKTNKHDSEQLMKAIDIMHRQFDILAILIIEIVKAQLTE